MQFSNCFIHFGLDQFFLALDRCYCNIIPQFSVLLCPTVQIVIIHFALTVADIDFTIVFREQLFVDARHTFGSIFKAVYQRLDISIIGLTCEFVPEKRVSIFHHSVFLIAPIHVFWLFWFERQFFLISFLNQYQCLNQTKQFLVQNIAHLHEGFLVVNIVQTTEKTRVEIIQPRSHLLNHDLCLICSYLCHGCFQCYWWLSHNIRTITLFALLNVRFLLPAVFWARRYSAVSQSVSSMPRTS